MVRGKAGGVVCWGGKGGRLGIRVEGVGWVLGWRG